MMGKSIYFKIRQISFYLGPDAFNYNEYCFLISYVIRPDECEPLTWVFRVSMGLPHFIRVGNGPYEPDVHYSERWTGREFTIKEFKWPFEIKLYR